ncbi:MAG: hypothetical protein Q9182_001106 [Xanthomendoza sp. 2 TL-2023]
MRGCDTHSEFPFLIRNGSRAGFHVHVYFHKDKENELKMANALRQETKGEFPELVVYGLWDKLTGPHPNPLFEVNIFTPAQFSTFVPWLAINHGTLRMLIHLITGDVRRDHIQNAIWIGDHMDLGLKTFEKEEEMNAVAK